MDWLAYSQSQPDCCQGYDERFLLALRLPKLVSASFTGVQFPKLAFLPTSVREYPPIFGGAQPQYPHSSFYPSLPVDSLLKYRADTKDTARSFWEHHTKVWASRPRVDVVRAAAE